VSSPPSFLLSASEPDALTRRLRSIGHLAPDESIDRLASAGAGNMNLTLRAWVGERTFIVKQSRPWVEKYPDIPAPPDRVLVEAAFYNAVASRPPVASAMPRLLWVDVDERMLALEDLGPSADCTDVYGEATLSDGERDGLLRWLSSLHAEPTDGSSDRLQNRAMRELNHAHIFDLPLQPGVFDADGFFDGLGPAAEALRADSAYVDAVRGLGRTYLADGDRLLHGDFYPGSWLRTAAGVRIIDPEFGFLGRPEFDLGVMLGHAVLAGGSTEEAAFELRSYVAPAGFSWPLAVRFAGVEIMRRLIGVAQLPLDADLARRLELLDVSRSLVLHPEDHR
jgi:5-methylthioribose kinase